MNEAEFNAEFERLVRENTPAPVVDISDFIRKCFNVTEEELEPIESSAVLQCASLLNLDCMALLLGVVLDIEYKNGLTHLDPSVTIDGRCLYFSVHLLNKVLVVRSAFPARVFNAFAELDLKSFGLQAN